MAKNAISTKLASLFSAQAKAAAEIRKDLDGIDAEIITAQNRLAEIARAPVSRDEIEARIDSFLLAQETEARTWFAPETFAAPDGSASGSGIATALAKPDSNLGALIILGFRSGIRENLVREALDAAKGNPLSVAERERETRRLNAEIADLEKVRERFAREAERHGITIPRSEFADPAALLAPDSEL